MWYKVVTFSSEEEAGRVYNSLHAALFQHNIDISVYRFVLAGAWYVIALTEEKPTLAILTKVESIVGSYEKATIPDGVLQGLFKRRKEGINKATHKPVVGLAYEKHTPSILEYDSDVPIRESDMHATAQETAAYLNKKYNVNVRPQKPGPRIQSNITLPKNRPFIANYQDYTFYKGDEVYKMFTDSLQQFRSHKDAQEAHQVVKLLDKVQIERLHTASKYLFMPSALALHHAVFKSSGDAVALPLDDMNTHHVWIWFNEPLETPFQTVQAVYCNNAYPLAEIEKIVPVRSQPDMHHIMRDTFLPHKNQWSLDIIGPSYDTLFDFTYDIVTNEWLALASHICPYGTCEYLSDRVSLLQTMGICIMCDSCKQANAYWSRWFKTAIDIIHRHYATSSEPKDFTDKREEYETEGKVLIGHGKNRRSIPGKVTRSITYTIVDVSVLTQTREREVEHANKRENWLTLADKSTIVYELRSIPKGSRTLDPSRNARWKYARTVDVRKHQKYVPMLADKKSMRVKKIVASKETPIEKG